MEISNSLQFSVKSTLFSIFLGQTCMRVFLTVSALGLVILSLTMSFLIQRTDLFWSDEDKDKIMPTIGKFLSTRFYNFFKHFLHFSVIFVMYLMVFTVLPVFIIVIVGKPFASKIFESSEFFLSKFFSFNRRC